MCLITVDVHEPSSIAEELGRLGATVVRKHLTVSDYELGCGAIVERKQVFDLHIRCSEGGSGGKLARCAGQ